MNEIQNKVIAKIQKLITLSMDDGATPHEREAASRMATKLMTKYNIQVLSTKTKDDMTTDNVEHTTVDMFYAGHGDRLNWEAYLSDAVSTPFGVRVIWSKGYGHGTVHFVGMPEDVDLALYFFEYLQIEIDVQGNEFFPRHKLKRNDFGIGMVARIRERLMDLYRRVHQELPSDCKALVVYKDKAVTDKVKQLFPRTRSNRAKPNIDRQAYSKGWVAGGGVDLSSNREQIHG